MGRKLTFDSEYEPFFQPPGWVVGPIWAVLYTCIAFSFSSVLNSRQELKHSNIIIVVFLVQLALNLAWPSVFNSERYLLSLVMITLMIVFTLIYAYLIHARLPTSSMLVWPYLAWIIFAAAINAAYYLHAK
ncbi:TspO/MBR family protein [Poseidonia sp.]|uniref:TspO/MBR family protein n=1 Tax=Poseidonia sp. TaxID=2666344 RepID=UPI003F699692